MEFGRESPTRPERGTPGERTPTPQLLELTTARLELQEGRKKYDLLFGQPQQSTPVHAGEGGTATLHAFTPGSRFGLNLWSRSVRGTIRWRCFVCETTFKGIRTDLVPTVQPGARILLSTHGAAQSRLFLDWWSRQISAGLEPLDCPAAFFEAVHFRLHGLRADRTFPWMLGGIAPWR